MSLGFVVMDVVWEYRSFYRFSAFLRLCESLGFRDLEQYVDFRVDTMEISTENNCGKSSYKKAARSLQAA